MSAISRISVANVFLRGGILTGGAGPAALATRVEPGERGNGEGWIVKLRQLKYIVAIVDNGLNVSAAAKRLYTSQPGISKQLKQLEEELGMEIFVRNGRNLSRVTPVGQEVIARARVIVREAETIQRLCRASLVIVPTSYGAGC